MKLNPIGIFAGLLLFVSVYLIRDHGREVFRYQDIVSTSPSKTWETAPIAQDQQQHINKKLNQKFYYLASGEQCHAFLGEDQQTVLKFFRHGNPTPVMESCKLAYEKLPDIAGILYLHFNPTSNLHGTIKIVDASYVEHAINLDKTEFLLQHYGELIFDRIDRQMAKGELEGAKESINIFLAAVHTWASRGFHVDNPSVKRNIGYVENHLLLLDTGSISQVEPTHEQITSEVRHTSSRLRRWLSNHHPELHTYFLEKTSIDRI